MLFYFKPSVPSEILARGSRAKEAFNRALLEEKGYIRRVPVMIVGQERTGKTGLKRSLKEELFNPNEGSTEGIETDPSYFKVSTDVWRTGKKSKDTESEPTFSFAHQVAQLVVESLLKKETSTPHSRSPSNSGTDSSKVIESVMTDQSPQGLKPDEKAKDDSTKEPRTVMDPSLQNSQDHLHERKLPDEKATFVQRLLKMNTYEDADDIYSVIWDFGVQSVYYDTRPIFLTRKAIYILTCDVSRDSSQKANAPTKKSMSGKIEDTCCSKTNLDFLDFWMSSVYSSLGSNTNHRETLLPEMLPPVFLVCAHADKPYRTDVDPGGLDSEIYSFLKDEVYGKLLKGLFVVDNSKSGSGDECRGVIKLRGKVLSFVKKLPQLNEAIPLKWLKYENVLHLLSKEGYNWVPVEKARQIGTEECGICDNKQFRTLLNFLHDQRVLIHFTESPELENVVIGQERTGKTSLKRFFKGEFFNPNEGSTEGIETDPSYFKVSTDVWRTGKKSKDTESEPTFSFAHQVAQLVVESLLKKETSTPHSRSPSNSGTDSSKVIESVMTDQSPQGLKPDEKAKDDSTKEPRTVMDPSLQNSQDHLHERKLPDEKATFVQRLLKMNTYEDADDIYSVIWDFGVQSVYYDTRPIFLTRKAIYILTCDVSRDSSQKANAPTKKSMSGKIEDTCCSKTNLDFLDFWMSSVYSSLGSNTNHRETLLPEMLPPVFLVCAHADKPYRTDVDPGGLDSEIYSFLKDEVYGKLLKGLFVVDNSKSGSGDECRGVIKLRGKVLSFVKKLPQLNEAIPLKWLKYENVLHLLSKEGYNWVPVEKARQIGTEECGICDNKQFRTLLNFLHDQRVLIHFTESPELENVVILTPQWLIDVFKKVITFKGWEDVEDDFLELWRNLEDHGILAEKLLDHTWKHLLGNQENCLKSLIAIMKKFSLLCEWPSEVSTKQYLVPSMLRSPPTSDVLELLASAPIPSLFVRFESRRVPPGLFSRLIVLFHVWAQKRWKSPIKPLLFNNLALFHIRPHNSTSLVLLCHFSSIEIVLCVGDGEALADQAGFSCEVDLNVSRDIRRQMRLFLECMRKECSWLEHMRYEMCVSCPVCSLQKLSSKCRDHCLRGCECLHLLSELEMQNLPFCKRPVVCGVRRICKEMFVPWFSFSDGQEGRISLTKVCCRIFQKTSDKVIIHPNYIPTVRFFHMPFQIIVHKYISD